MATVMMMNKAESESLSSYNSEVDEKHVRHIDNEVVNFCVLFHEDNFDDDGDCVFNLGEFDLHNSEHSKHTDNHFPSLTIM